MKMIRAIIRPEMQEKVVRALDSNGFVSMTKIDVFGRGKQKGIRTGSILYDELPKTMLMMVVEDEDCQKVVDIILQNAYTGNFGDGKIFISPVEQAYTIRTGEKKL
ncbi:P-II family nitrogen regulator [Anaerocellum danielii]|uniref:P-II family nitrogen regulator n=1 Tax=Anaerocellum danielii TaxID=1387557 RepID=A0ABZ0U0M8_9FIRM|nr:P-II family nitrogen regulator [Caldicellulosiruptor danielii]WPX09281.1 P-II family nitrogen regulator [Caldicellulosiruptor danielii]